MGEKDLRALLAEAREIARLVRNAGSLPYAQWSRDQHEADSIIQRIDAALAEPVARLNPYSAAVAEMRGDAWQKQAMQRERERDEARAEVERLRSLKPIGTYSLDWNHEQERMTVARAAYQRGAEAMREAAALVVDNDPVVLRSYRGVQAGRIRALRVPEDKP